MSETHDKFVIGIDVGGTNIRSAKISRSGKIHEQNSSYTPLQNNHVAIPSVLAEAILASAEPLLDDRTIGIGIGSGGQFNPRTGVMLGVHTDRPEFINYPFAQSLKDQLNLPVFIDNDVKTAALAELRIGAARDYQHVVAVAVGTFIGGAIALDGKIVHGASGLAGHIGQVVDFQTGSYIEDIAGGAALAYHAIQQNILNPDQSTEDIFINARNGDTNASQFIQHAGESLGFALAGIAHFIQPEVILVGGSVGLQPEYLKAINSGLAAKLMSNWRSIRAIPMQLGTEAGQVGAGLRVFEELGL